MLSLLFLTVLIAPLARAITAGNRAGGQVCDFQVKYDLIWAGGDYITPQRSFVASLSLNATGYYQTTFEYRPGDDPCLPEGPPYAWEEQGVSAFSFYYPGTGRGYSRDNGTIDWNGPWFRHFPLGLPSTLMDMNEIADEYFQYFIFVAGDGDFWPCCEWSDCKCVCGVDETVHCVNEIVRTDCYDNTIPFNPNVVLTYTPDGTFTPSGDISDSYVITCGDNISTDIVSTVIYAEGNSVIYKDAQHHMVDLSNDLCPIGTPCWYFRQTPGWEGPQLELILTMDARLGQAQRLQLQLRYQSLPNNKGPACVYFDYSGVHEESSTDFDETSFNKVWCGSLQPYNAGQQTLFITLPMTYGPASDDIFTYFDYAGQGYDVARPIIITGNQASSFVVYELTILAMGEGNHDDCRRRQDDGNTTSSRIVPVNYTQYVRPRPGSSPT